MSKLYFEMKTKKRFEGEVIWLPDSRYWERVFVLMQFDGFDFGQERFYLIKKLKIYFFFSNQLSCYLPGRNGICRFWVL
jgi:hypothetical protein